MVVAKSDVMLMKQVMLFALVRRIVDLTLMKRNAKVSEQLLHT